MDLTFDERAMEGLTFTERKIMEEYLRGLKPKEIATRLKVSIKTVYKAVWKYRKNFRALHRERDLDRGRYPVNNIAATAIAMEMVAHGLRKVLEYSNMDKFDEVIILLRRIDDKLAKISDNLSQLLSTISGGTPITVKPTESPTTDNIESKLPDFLRDNPWLEVLRTR